MSQKFTATSTVVFESDNYKTAQEFIMSALGSEPTADIQKIDLYRWSPVGGSPTPSPEFVVDTDEKANIAGLAAARLNLAATAFWTKSSGEDVDSRSVRYLIERVVDERYGNGWTAVIEASDGYKHNQLVMRAQRSGGIDATIPFEVIDGKIVANLVAALMTPLIERWDFQIWVDGIPIDNWSMGVEETSVRRIAYRMTGPSGEAIAGGGTSV